MFHLVLVVLAVVAAAVVVLGVDVVCVSFLSLFAVVLVLVALMFLLLLLILWLLVGVMLGNKQVQPSIASNNQHQCCFSSFSATLKGIGTKWIICSAQSFGALLYTAPWRF